MAQPKPLKTERGSVPTPDRKDVLGQLHKGDIQSRISAYVDPYTHWIMAMRERDEFVCRCSASVSTFSRYLYPQNPDDYRMKDRLLYSGSIVWKKDNRGKGVSLLIYILNTHRMCRRLELTCFL